MEEARGLRIGIMGGTFNPIHMGHLLLAETARTEEKLDRIIFIPNGCPYMKQKNEVLDAAHRLKMVELAIADNPFFSVSDMEIQRDGNTYTCDTLRQLQTEYPSDTFYFLMGADCLFSIEKWKNPQEIFSRCILLAAVRNNADISQMEGKCAQLSAHYRTKVKLLSFPETEISSTIIRNCISENRSIRYMVPEPVRRYIEEYQLYR